MPDDDRRQTYQHPKTSGDALSNVSLAVNIFCSIITQHQQKADKRKNLFAFFN